MRGALVLAVYVKRMRMAFASPIQLANTLIKGLVGNYGTVAQLGVHELYVSLSELRRLSRHSYSNRQECL